MKIFTKTSLIFPAIFLALFIVASPVSAEVIGTERVDDVVTIYHDNLDQNQLRITCSDGITPATGARHPGWDGYILESFNAIFATCGVDSLNLQDDNDVNVSGVYSIPYSAWSGEGEPPPTTMDEGATGSVIGGFIGGIADQITTNLPAILLFLAGMVFLLLGIRWVKRAVK